MTPESKVADAEWRFPNAATPPGSSVYYSLRLAPPTQRDPLALLHAWRQRLRALPWSVSEPAVGLATLGWWREECARIHSGQPSHPLGAPLAELVRRHALPAAPLLDPIERAEARLLGRTPETPTDWLADAERDLGALFELSARLQGIETTAQLARARRLGAYCTLVGEIRASGWLLRQGWSGFLSDQQWRALALDPAHLLQPEGRARLADALRAQAPDIEALRASLDPAGLPPDVRIQVRLRDRLWRELARADFALADERLSLNPLHKLWHAWRAR